MELEFSSEQHAKLVALQVARAQAERAKKNKRMIKWTDDRFPKQNAFINDQSTLIAAQCPRRSGKSEGLGRKQLGECFNFPGSNQLYIGLTLASARAIMWEPIVKRLNEEMKLGGKPNESRLEMKFEHAPGVVSQYVLFGADASAREIDKKLGGKYRSIVIDEAAFFKQDLNDMVYEKLLPCVADFDGWIALASTTSEYTRGLFYDVTNHVEPGWSIHKWTGEDNPYMREKLAKQIAMLKKNKPRIEETPAFRRMYLNEWVIDHDSFCYKYDRERNDCEELPGADEMVNVLGIDLGFNDPTAFALLSYSEYDPCAYIRHAYKRSAMIISEVAERIAWYIEKFNPTACVIDNASKQAVEELKQKFSLPLIAAEKTGKAEFIEIMNSDFILGNIKLLPDAEPLKKEYGQLIWDKDKLPKKVEHPGCENHISDSSLYAFRYCYQYRYEKRPKKLTAEEHLEMQLEKDFMDESEKEWWEK